MTDTERDEMIRQMAADMAAIRRALDPKPNKGDQPQQVRGL